MILTGEKKDFRKEFGIYVSKAIVNADVPNGVGDRRDATYRVRSMLLLPPGVLFDEVTFTDSADPFKFEFSDSYDEIEAVFGRYEHDLSIRLFGNEVATILATPASICMTNEYDKHNPLSDNPRDPDVDLHLARGLFTMVELEMFKQNLVVAE